MPPRISGPLKGPFLTPPGGPPQKCPKSAKNRVFRGFGDPPLGTPPRPPQKGPFEGGVGVPLARPQNVVNQGYLFGHLAKYRKRSFWGVLGTPPWGPPKAPKTGFFGVLGGVPQKAPKSGFLGVLEGTLKTAQKVSKKVS